MVYRIAMGTLHYKHLRMAERREEQRQLDEMNKLRLERAHAEHNTKMLQKKEKKNDSETP